MPRRGDAMGAVSVVPARLDWLEALAEGDDVFTARFGIAVEPDWAGFPEAIPHAVASARRRSEDPWGSQLFFDGVDGALIGFGGFKDVPRDGDVEIGYAVAPARQGRGIATAVVGILLERAVAAGVATVSAHTLGTDNPSTAVLRRCSFQRVAELDDPELGLIWRWELAVDAAGR